MITAAHCVANGGFVAFQKHSINYTAKCTHHKKYASDDTSDWALCKVSNPVSINSDEWFENLATSYKFKVGDKIFLSGYGCKQPGGNDGMDGKFRGGYAVVRALPNNTDQDIVTSQGAALCFGDSGGSAWYIANGTREVIAINSRGNMSDTSYLSNIINQSFMDFAKSWSSDNGAQICGYEKLPECWGADAPLPSPIPSPIPSPMPSPIPSPDISPKPSPSISPMPSPMPSPIPSPIPSPSPYVPTPSQCKTAHYTVFSCFNAGIYQYAHCKAQVKVLDLCVDAKYNN